MDDGYPSRGSSPPSPPPPISPGGSGNAEARPLVDNPSQVRASSAGSCCWSASTPSRSRPGTSYSNNFTLPNSDAQRAADLLQHSFPAQAGDRDTIVYKVGSGTVRDPAVRARMSATFARVAKLPHVAAVISPYAGAVGGQGDLGQRQDRVRDRRVRRKSQQPAQRARAERVVSTARAAGRAGTCRSSSADRRSRRPSRPGFGLSTAVGLLAAIVVLLLTFGSLTAMGLPIVTALFGLGTGLGAIALFTHVVDTPNFSSELAAMIGLGVGIDYALFILTRFREAYATPGPTFGNARESVVQAMDTAGRAVLFAGCTVVIALLGMMLLGVDFLYGVAISASIGVLLVMLASLTLLPALLTIAGARVARPSRRARAREAREAEAPPRRPRPAPHAGHDRRPTRAGAGDAARQAGRTWLRWSAFVQRRPWTIAVASTLVMLRSPRRRSRCGSARATPPTTPRARPPTAPTSCSRRASAKASTGRCWSSRRSRDPSTKPPSRAWRRPATGRQRRLGRTTARGDRRDPGRGRRSPRPSSTRPAKWRRSPSTRTPPRRPTRRPSSSHACATTWSRRSQAHTGMAVYVGGVTAGRGRLRHDARPQAAAVHRRRRAALARCC